MRLLSASLLVLSLLLGGCDLFESEPDTRVVATGTVVLEGTSEPIEGLSVVLRASGDFGSSVIIRARTTTVEDGSFELTFEGSRGKGYSLLVNDGPKNDSYSTFSDPMFAGESKDFGVIELEPRP